MSKKLQRINVVGTSGSGKSTFSAQLIEILDYPYIQLDDLYWAENWSEVPNDIFLAELSEQLQQPQWVLDGNYTDLTGDLKWPYVDTIIWIDFRFWRTLKQAVTRAFSRLFRREKMWRAENQESWGVCFQANQLSYGQCKPIIKMSVSTNDSLNLLSFPIWTLSD